ncbi:MAG: hypothetical protein Q7S96_04910 [bacterium]|nr:hypothetical protein [bacterium]
MMRFMVIVVFLLTACGTANQQELTKLRLQLAGIQARNATLTAQLAQRPAPAQTATELHTRPPLRGDIDSREEFCTGAMCLEVWNGSTFPITELFVDNRPVELHSHRGPILWPKSRVYILLHRPGLHTIQATLTNAVHVPGGAIPTGVKVGECHGRRQVPLTMDENLGVARVRLGQGTCNFVQ